MQIRIALEDLIFTQQEVEQEGVDLYIKKIQNGESFETVKARFCKHKKGFYIIDGHHKSYTMYHHFGIRDVDLEYEDCSEPYTAQLPEVDPCVARDEFERLNYFLGSIKDLKVVDYSDFVDK